jgi:hypothetical protein
LEDRTGQNQMDKNEIIALIKQRRDEYRDRSLAAGPGTTDADVIQSAQRAWEFADEYDRLLAIIEMEGVLSSSQNQSIGDNYPSGSK